MRAFLVWYWTALYWVNAFLTVVHLLHRSNFAFVSLGLAAVSLGMMHLLDKPKED